MGAVGLQTHIWNNNLRSAFLLAGFPVLLLGIVYALELGMIGAGMLPSTGSLGGDLAYALRLMAAASPLAIAVALVWFAIAYFANTAIIGLATGARTVARAEQPALYNLLENLCISRGLKTPRLSIIETDGMNAFASGVDASQYTITVTRGLMETLSPDELEGVLAHELTHVINRDVRTMVIASVFAGVITLVAQIVYRAVAWGGVGRREGRRGGGLLVLVALVAVGVGYVLSIVIRMALSRSREFVADAGAVELTKNPDAMISALQKISGHSQVEAPESVRALFLDNHGEGPAALFATHPPIAKRIEALVRFAGGRVAPPPPPPPLDRPVVKAPGPWDEPKVGPWS